MSTEAEVIFAELQRSYEPGKQAELADFPRLIARDNVQIRARFLGEFATLTAAELARDAGDDAAPRRWLDERRVFSVPVGAEERFPAFQFADGRPLPVVGKVLAVLPLSRSAWQIALWFVSNNNWLGGGTPLQHLADAEQVWKRPGTRMTRSRVKPGHLSLALLREQTEHTHLSPIGSDP